MTFEPWDEGDSIILTVALVVRDGHHMPVRGVDRVAVVRAMARQGATLDEIAHRTCSQPAEIEEIRRRLGLTLARRQSWAVPA